MPAYMVVQATVTNPEQFTEYAERMPALVEKFGGTYRVLGGEVETTRPARCGIRTNTPS